MTQAEQKPDENSSATQAEIERLKQELSRERDMHLHACVWRNEWSMYHNTVE